MDPFFIVKIAALIVGSLVVGRKGRTSGTVGIDRLLQRGMVTGDRSSQHLVLDDQLGPAGFTHSISGLSLTITLDLIPDPAALPLELPRKTSKRSYPAPAH